MNAHQTGPDGTDGPDEPDGRIAIIGMAGRFPGAESPDELWDLLVSGREALSRFTPEDCAHPACPTRRRRSRATYR
ncbi:beta-ketoacyl synthase N-terminal-like domain-containing protein [Streptomyces sp. 12297]